MTDKSSRALQLAFTLGAVSLALILGVLYFQYVEHLPPCEMCMWQRYPHFVAIALGLGGGILVASRLLPAKAAYPIALLTIAAIALSGAIGVYHAGVEWRLWQGPASCTGHAFQVTGKLDLNAPVVSCENAQWRTMGISLAGYNALISIAAALTGLALLFRRSARHS